MISGEPVTIFIIWKKHYSNFQDWGMLKINHRNFDYMQKVYNIERKP